MKRILEVVEITKIDVLVDGIAALCRQEDILHFRPSDSLQPNWKLSSADGLARDRDDCSLFVPLQRCGVDFDNNAQDVGTGNERDAWRSKSHTTGFQRLQKSHEIEKERIRAKSGKNANAVVARATRVVDEY